MKFDICHRIFNFLVNDQQSKKAEITTGLKSSTLDSQIDQGKQSQGQANQGKHRCYDYRFYYLHIQPFLKWI